MRRPNTNLPFDEYKLDVYSLWGRPGHDVADTVLAAATAGRDAVIPADTTSGAFAITIPLAAEMYPWTYFVKKIAGGANALTVSRSGSDTIDGAATATVTNAVILASDGLNRWHILASY